MKMKFLQNHIIEYQWCQMIKDKKILNIKMKQFYKIYNNKI